MRKNMLPLAFLLIGMALAFSNCGSGGGSVPLAELNAANSPQVAGSMDQVISLIDPASSLGGIEVAASSSRPPLAMVIDSVKAISRSRLRDSGLSAQAGMARAGMAEEEIPCDSGSGTMSADWDGSALITDPLEVLNLKVAMTFDHCTMGEETLHGSATMAFLGSFIDPEKVTLTTTPNLDFTSTASPDGETDISMSGFRMEVTGDPTGGTMTMSGSISGVAEGTPVDAEFDGLTLTTEMVPGGSEFSIYGRVKSSCIGGWLAFSTPSPVFIATDADCPTEGDVAAASGDNTVNVVAGPGSTEITIYYNSAEVVSYPDCEEVGGLCG